MIYNTYACLPVVTGSVVVPNEYRHSELACQTENCTFPDVLDGMFSSGTYSINKPLRYNQKNIETKKVYKSEHCWVHHTMLCANQSQSGPEWSIRNPMKLPRGTGYEYR